MIILIDRTVALSSFVDRVLLIISFGPVRNAILALVRAWLNNQFLARPISRFIRAFASVDVTDPVPTALPKLKGHGRDELGLMSATMRRFLLSSGDHLKKLRETEQTLSESEAKFRNLAEGSIQGIIIHRHGKILFANQAHAGILGYGRPSDLMALDSFAEFISPADREQLVSYAER